MASKKANVFIDNSPSIDQTARAQVFAPQPPTMDSVIDDAGDIMGTLASGGVTDDRQPEFQGQGTPGDTILIRNHGVEIGQTVVDDDGQWAFTPSTDMSEGHHAITIVARDPASNESEPSGPFNFEIDVTPPNASKLAITGVLDTAGGITGNVAAGKTTDDTRPLLTGTSTGQPGHTVTVMVRDSTGTHALGEAVVGDNGQWSLQVMAPLAAGLNTFTLVEKDAAGNETAPTGRYQVTIDTSKPTPPVIEHVYDDVGVPHMLAPGEVTNDARPTLHGTAQPGHTVTFHDGTTVLGTTETRADGTWAFTPKDNLSEGAHHITATATGPVGQTGDASNGWHFEVDTLAPTQTPTVSGIGKDSGMNADDHATNDGSAGRLMTGRLGASLAAGETLQVSTDGGQTWKTAFVNGTQWSAQDDHSHAGDWTVQTRVVDAAGNMGPVNSQTVTLDTTTPHAPTAVVLGNGQVTVSFDKAAVSPGDRIHLLNGKQNVDHLLTAADIAAGQATVAVTDVSLNLAASVVTGTGNNTLKLSLADVMNNGAKDQFVADGRVQMMVKGNAGDAVTLSDVLPNGTDPGDWVKKANVTVGGVVYEVYQHSGFDAELLVQQGVTVTLQNAGAGTFHIEPELEAYVLDHATMTWTDSDDTLIARLGFADRLEGGAGNDTFTKVGTGDTVHGGAGDDTIRINSGDFTRLDGGLGIDTLVMDGKAMHIDLSALGAKLQGFEKFDLGVGGNTLALSAQDLLAGGARDMVTTDGKVQMLVNGANGDVNLLGGDDGWTLGNAATVGGVTYSVYTNLAGTAELLVEDKVHVTIL
ncbi:Ig-like domain-containing protein [Variovorax boronicumulans]|uniref:Ig-like domain-containing protein n=1 Tax=Variovorax boronicumulans TaxID=436515 RepID=UPI0012E6508E|nr:Ig-like domain-containing protein [Variovorax boronicumulans]GER15403.1 hypothetical protein VCH24_03930 [Variovorax boronicumulans]